MSSRAALRTLLAVLALTVVVPDAARADLPSTASSDPVITWYDATAVTVARTGWSTAGNTQIVASKAWAVAWGAADDAIAALPKDLSAKGRSAAETAALVTAVHFALVSLAPAQRADLSALRKTTLARIPDSAAKAAGRRAGLAAAKASLAARQGDGIDVSSINPPYTPPPVGLGVWQPTAPAFGGAVQSGQGKAKPWLVPDVVARFPADPPPAIDSPTTIADLQEIDRLGTAGSTERTDEQTLVARFWSQTSVAGFTSVLHGVLAGNRTPLPRRVHLVATFHKVTTDAQIAVYAAKYVYLRWRPITALRTDDGNPDTPYDPSFTPLINTPAHPEYPSGHTGYAGAAEEVLRTLVGPRPPKPIVAASTATPAGYRVYDDWSQVTQDNVDARVWEGIHLRSTDVSSVAYGKRIAAAALTTDGETPAR